MKKLLARFVRQSPAMIVAMLALFVALTGTAVATTSALITGAQIKNSSITGTDVKNKSLTARDFKGSVRGAQGLRGVAGATGASGAKGDKGDKGDTGATGPFPDPLESGKTLRGTFALSGYATTTNVYTLTPISFVFRLASAPTSHWVPTGGTPPAQCPGSASAPEAAPGHLCVYEATQENMSASRGVTSITHGGGGTHRFGTLIYGYPNAAGARHYSTGSWAVTAP